MISTVCWRQLLFSRRALEVCVGFFLALGYLYLHYTPSSHLSFLFFLTVFAMFKARFFSVFVNL